MNLDLERAADALSKVENLAGKSQAGKYVSYVKSLPAAILQNGLGQAMATLLAAAGGKVLENDAHGALYQHLESWLCRNDACAPYRGKKNLMQAITGGEQLAYLHAQGEAMAYLNWLKKFAVAYLVLREDETP